MDEAAGETLDSLVPDRDSRPSGRPSGRLIRPVVHKGNLDAWTDLADALEAFDALVRGRLLLALLSAAALFGIVATQRQDDAALVDAIASGIAGIVELAIAVAFLRFSKRLRGLGRSSGPSGAASAALVISGIGTLAHAALRIGWGRALPREVLGVLDRGFPAFVAHVSLLVGFMATTLTFAALADALVRRTGEDPPPPVTRHVASARSWLFVALTAAGAAHGFLVLGSPTTDARIAVGALGIAFAFLAAARYVGAVRHVRDTILDGLEAAETDSTHEWVDLERNLRR